MFEARVSTVGHDFCLECEKCRCYAENAMLQFNSGKTLVVSGEFNKCVSHFTGISKLIVS
jgi:hypothetical protein